MCWYIFLLPSVLLAVLVPGSSSVHQVLKSLEYLLCVMHAVTNYAHQQVV